MDLLDAQIQALQIDILTLLDHDPARESLVSRLAQQSAGRITCSVSSGRKCVERHF